MLSLNRQDFWYLHTLLLYDVYFRNLWQIKYSPIFFYGILTNKCLVVTISNWPRPQAHSYWPRPRPRKTFLASASHHLASASASSYTGLINIPAQTSNDAGVHSFSNAAFPSIVLWLVKLTLKYRSVPLRVTLPLPWRCTIVLAYFCTALTNELFRRRDQA